MFKGVCSFSKQVDFLLTSVVACSRFAFVPQWTTRSNEMNQKLQWARAFPNSTNNFDLVLLNPQDLDSKRMIALLDGILSETHRGLTLSSRAIKEFRRWFERPDMPLKSEAYVLLSNWFMTQSGDRHSMVATHCEHLWDALFPCRPTDRLSSPEPGRNHVILPAEFESLWRRILETQGDSGETNRPPADLNIRLQARTDDPAEATDNPADQLRASLEINGRPVDIVGSPRAISRLLRMLSGPDE